MFSGRSRPLVCFLGITFSLQRCCTAASFPAAAMLCSDQMAIADYNLVAAASLPQSGFASGAGARASLSPFRRAVSGEAAAECVSRRRQSGREPAEVEGWDAGRLVKLETWRRSVL